MTTTQFKKAREGIFNSKLRYCLHVFGNVWGITNMDDSNRRFTAFNKEDNRRLQVLQNKVLRLKTGLRRDCPTAQLLETAGDLSVQQQTAYFTLMTVFRSVTSGKPKYICEKMKLRRPVNDEIFPQRQLNTITVSNSNLSVTRGGFVYRGAQLFNSLPVSLRTESKVSSFKRRLKAWTKTNIPIKPT